MQVAREQCHCPNVLGADEPRDPALESDGETAMRRHAVGERLQIRLILFYGLTAGLDSRNIVRISVQPLPPSHQLLPAEQ